MPLYPPLLSHICPCFHPFFLYCIGYRVIKNTGASYWTKYTLCTGLAYTGHKSWVWRYFLWVMEGGRRGRRLSPPAPSACLRSAAQPPPPPGQHLRLEELHQQQQHPWQDAPVGRFLHLRRHRCLLRRRWAFSVFNLSKSLWKDKLWTITHIQLPCFQAILRRLLEEAGGEGPWPQRCDGQPLGIDGLLRVV